MLSINEQSKIAILYSKLSDKRHLLQYGYTNNELDCCGTGVHINNK